MGVNNRQRRAAKRRKRASSRQGRPGGAGGGYGWADEGSSDARRAIALSVVLAALREVEADRTTAAQYADLFTDPDSPVAPRLVREVLEDLLANVLREVVRGGWAPSDLAEITVRRASPGHLPALAALLAAETDRHLRSRVAPAWLDDLAGLGRAEPADLMARDGVEVALGLCAVLGDLPAITEIIPPPGMPVTAARAGSGTDAKLLGRVRSLLAKAESTQFPEEAEALSAKAQELISRYALDRLVHEAGHGRDGAPVTARRLWIDKPYVMAKAMLIDAVASANRCRSVVTEHLGFSTVIGEPGDLEAVELLVTSLLVQANTAMLGYGRQADRRGTSRTKSFRRSFLVSYASRIGERLQAATSSAVDETGRVGELVPVLRRQAERVQATVEEMFPHVVSRATSINNSLGWAAGRAAADLALLDVNLAVTEAAS
jgi:hypothetical protein